MTKVLLIAVAFVVAGLTALPANAACAPDEQRRLARNAFFAQCSPSCNRSFNCGDPITQKQSYDECIKETTDFVVQCVSNCARRAEASIACTP